MSVNSDIREIVAIVVQSATVTPSAVNEVYKNGRHLHSSLRIFCCIVYMKLVSKKRSFIDGVSRCVPNLLIPTSCRYFFQI